MELLLNKENFEEEVKKYSGKVLVDFYADWCGPCKMMAPAIEKLAEEVKEYAKVGKVNVDDNQELSMEYNVMSIPTLIIFLDGQEVKRFVGVTSKSELLDALK